MRKGKGVCKRFVKILIYARSGAEGPGVVYVSQAGGVLLRDRAATQFLPAPTPAKFACAGNGASARRGARRIGPLPRGPTRGASGSEFSIRWANLALGQLSSSFFVRPTAPPARQPHYTQNGRRRKSEDWWVFEHPDRRDDSYSQVPAILSVYDKTGLLDLAKGLVHNNVRLLASGGTARTIREAGFPVE